MRILIVDDEPLAQQALAQILTARTDVQSFDCSNDAVDALEKLGKRAYDLLLLDVNMPELSGIELLDRLREDDATPSIIFVTAHGDYALHAFDRHAIDYVLKPFTSERVHQALDVASHRTASEKAAKLMSALPKLRELSRPAPSRIAIKGSGRILFVDPTDIVAVQAQGNYVLLHRETGSYLLRETISEMAETLEPLGFIRIHRSTLVNTSFVQEIRPRSTGEYELRLNSGREYIVSRTYRKNLKALADFWIGADSLHNN